MVTKAKSGKKEQKQKRVKLGQLKLNKETVKNLTASEVRKVRGGTGKACTGGGTKLV